MAASLSQKLHTLTRPAREAFNTGSYFTAFVYVLLVCLSQLARRTENRNLSSDVYVMF